MKRQSFLWVVLEAQLAVIKGLLNRVTVQAFIWSFLDDLYLLIMGQRR